MGRSRVRGCVRRIRGYARRIRAEIRAASEEPHTTHEIAGSFAIGVFITSLPSLGLGLLVFAGLVALSARISKIAIFSSALVLNPAFKPGVYYASYRVGDTLVGADPLAVFGDELLDPLADLTLRFLLGNVLVGLALAAVGYVAVRRLAEVHRQRRRIDRI